jgi:hypothetical protein
MSINELLILEFDQEMKNTRTTLERVPADKKDFAPHSKSMPLGKLAPHVAQLPSFGLTVLTTPELDFSKRSFTPLQFESTDQLLKALDEGSGSRFLAYREMFLNHLVHHRAQLGVYLRLNGKPVPATYGPSADDTMGF